MSLRGRTAHSRNWRDGRLRKHPTQNIKWQTAAIRQRDGKIRCYFQMSRFFL